MHEEKNNIFSEMENRLFGSIADSIRGGKTSPGSATAAHRGMFRFARDEEGDLMVCGFAPGRTASELVIPDGVVSIGEGAFKESAITSVVFPGSLEAVGKDAFSGCKRLGSVTFRSNTICVSENAFAECAALERLDLPAELLAAEPSAFYGCAVKNLTLPPQTLLGGCAFADCRALERVVFLPPDEDGYKLFFGDFAFMNTGISEMTIPSGDVEMRPGVFFNCRKLRRVSLPEDMTEIPEKTFLCCTALESIAIPDGVRTIGKSAFFRCSSLTSVYIPDSVETIGKVAFGDCGSLCSVRLPLAVGFCDQPAVGGRTEKSFFRLAKSVNVTFGRSMFGFSGEILMNELICSVLGLAFEGDEGAIADFSENTAALLRSVIRRFGDKLGMKDIIRLAELLPSVKERIHTRERIYTAIDLPEYGESWLMGFADGCSAEKVIVPVGITHIAGRAFGSKLDIVSVRFPSSLRWIGDGAFENCYALGSVDLPGSVVRIGSAAFNRCFGLKSAALKNGRAELGNGIFCGCRDLSRVSLPEDMETIPEKMFCSCGSLEEIELPMSLTFIGAGAFSDTSLYSVSVPAGVTEIGDGAFMGCERLKKLGLPGGVRKLGDRLINDCHELESLSMILNEDLDILYNYRCLADKGIYFLKRVKVSGRYFDISGRLDTFVFRRIAEQLAKDGNAAAVAALGKLAPEYEKTAKLRDSRLFRICTGRDENGTEYIYVEGFAEGVSVPEARIPDGVTNIGRDAFSGCNGVRRLVVPESVRYYSGSAFRESGFEEIVLEGGITELYEYMFKDCRKLRKPMLPEGLEIIGKGAFSGCVSLAAIVIPDSVRLIRLGAFSGCTKLRSVKMPLCRLIDSTDVGKRPFYSCDSLELVLIEGREYHPEGRFDMAEMSRIAADLLHEGSANAARFMTESGEYVLKQLVKSKDIPRTERLLSEFDGFTAAQIDSAVELSSKEEENEIYLALLAYKRDKQGFGGVADRFEL